MYNDEAGGAYGEEDEVTDEGRQCDSDLRKRMAMMNVGTTAAVMYLHALVMPVAVVSLTTPPASNSLYGTR